jgi:hypothetical protein
MTRIVNTEKTAVARELQINTFPRQQTRDARIAGNCVFYWVRPRLYSEHIEGVEQGSRQPVTTWTEEGIAGIGYLATRRIEEPRELVCFTEL